MWSDSVIRVHLGAVVGHFKHFPVDLAGLDGLALARVPPAAARDLQRV